MRLSTLSIALLLMVSAVTSFAQTKVIRCYSDELYHKNMQTHPGYQQTVQRAYNNAKTQAEKTQKTGSYTFDTIYHIPVVVHIVYKTAAQNLPDSLVYNQLEVMNQDYRRLNADTFKTRSYFKQFAGDARIEFELATTDPQGNPTTGITRTQTTRAYYSPFSNGLGVDSVKFDAFGGIDAWPVDKYLNIWVCNMDDNNGFGLVLGFSYPPASAPDWPAGSVPVDTNLQGVVIHYAVFGRNNHNASGQLANANNGRTVTHEVGHYLGLRHIWGDGGFLGSSNNCVPDDSIWDTPKADMDAQNLCDTTKNTCNDSLIMGFDYPDMIENYMDYADEHCQNIFTHGQIALMRSMLETARTSLATKTIDTSGTPDVSGILTSTYESKVEVKLYPNPANGSVNIVVDNMAEKGELSLLNILGCQVSNPVSLEPGGNNIQMPLDSYAKGVYIVRITSGDNVTTRKLVVE